MTLTLHKIRVRDVRLADVTRLEGGHLTLDAGTLAAELESADPGRGAADEALPRIAYVYMVLSQGRLHDTYVMGSNAAEGLPLIVDPRIVIDNGVVSGNCVSACEKNTTYIHTLHAGGLP